MIIKIIDDSQLKLDNKERDDSLKNHISKLDQDKIDYVKVIRSKKGEVVLWETHYWPIKEKEVSEWQKL